MGGGGPGSSRDLHLLVGAVGGRVLVAALGARGALLVAGGGAIVAGILGLAAGAARPTPAEQGGTA